MKIKLLTLLCSVFLFSAINAQTIKIGELQKIDTESSNYYPVFVNDGQALLVTNEDYSGLKMLNLLDGSIKILTNDSGAGYGMRVENNLIKYKAITFKNNSKAYQDKSISINNVKSARVIANNDYAVNEDLKIAIYKNGKKSILMPNGDDRRYLWPSLSPDGNKVVYTVSGLGSFVYDLTYDKVTYLGKFNAPKWINNDFVVGMVNKDDGYKFTASSIIISNVDGTYLKSITPNSIIAMYPSAYDDNIVFNTSEGEIYMIKVEINK